MWYGRLSAIGFQLSACRRNATVLASRRGSAADSRSHLEAEDDLPQLDAVAVVQLVIVRHDHAVDAREVGRGIRVDQDKAIAPALDQGVLLLYPHVAEQGDVRMLVAAKAAAGLVQDVLAAFLPA